MKKFYENSNAVTIKSNENGGEMNYSGYNFGLENFSREVLGDYFSLLGNNSVNRNSLLLENLHSFKPADIFTEYGLYKCGSSAEYVFMLCEHWDLQDEVKYLALEIFDRFMCSLVSQLHNHIYTTFLDASTPLSSNESNPSTDKSASSNSSYPMKGRQRQNASSVLSSHEKLSHRQRLECETSQTTNLCVAAKEWKRTINHLKGQMELRAITCVTIASKLTSHYEIVTLNKSSEFLKKQGHSYNKSALIKSEMRILKALDYNIGSLPTLHPYIITMLEILARSESTLPINQLYYISMRVLDLFYYFRPFIFARLCKTPVDENGHFCMESEDTARNLLEAMNDLLLTSSALISCAAYLKDKAMSDQVICLLSKMIGTPETSITKFSFVILDVTLAPTQLT